MLNRDVQKLFVPYRTNKYLNRQYFQEMRKYLVEFHRIILIDVQLFLDFQMLNDATIRNQIGRVYHLCYLCFVFVMFTCLVIAALWSPAGKGLTSCLSCV